MLAIPHCLDNRLIDGGKIVDSRLIDDGKFVIPNHQPHFTPQNIFPCGSLVVNALGYKPE
jgi:hypothetical protein